MVLTLRNDRGQVVDVLRFPKVVETGQHRIDIDQPIVDLLAIMLTDRPPGVWDLEIDYPDKIGRDSGPIISGLHRSSGSGIPVGCSPCQQEHASAPTFGAKSSRKRRV